VAKKHQPADTAVVPVVTGEIIAGPDSPDADLELAASRALAPMLELIESLPSVDDDPTPRMMRAIYESPDAATWEDLFTAQHFKDHAGDKVRVVTFRPSKSSYAGKLGWFLVCEVIWLETGEQDVLTVGGQMALAQLLNCWKRGDLPHDFEIVRKDKPTAKGFYPMRLRSIRTRAQIEG
jgi:hypothetical protein